MGLRTATRFATAAAALAATVALSACGGGDEDHPTPTEPPAELLRQAAANPAQSGNADINLDMNLEGSSLLAGPVSGSAVGPFERGDDGSLPSFDFDVNGEVAGFGLDAELVSTGDDGYVVFFGENYRAGPEVTAQAQAALDSGTAAGGGLGLDVASWIRDPRYGGSEEAGGTDTERIEGTLDKAAISRDLTRIAAAVGAPPLLEVIARSVGSGPVAAFVSYDDPDIRGVEVEFPFTVPPELEAEARGITGGTVSLDAEVSDVGEDVTIEPPEGGGFQPLTDLIERLRDLAALGGL